ncbi:MAG: cadmium-translocating P-type ATPase [Terrimicrobiaceae bacterium]|nr:cadmium-translocating P-type ATPase [Terrimicrobiaceae bacterium]
MELGHPIAQQFVAAAMAKDQCVGRMSCCCHDHAAKAPRADAWGKYTCPMHPEVIRESAGDCPICGMALEPVGPAPEDDREEKNLFQSFLVAGLFTAPLFLLAMSHWLPGGGFREWTMSLPALWVQALLSVPVFLWAGLPFHLKAWRSVLARRANMFTLITLGTGAAWVFSLWSLIRDPARHHAAVYFEASAMIILLALGGQLLEVRGRRRAGTAVRGLLDLAPPRALRISAGREEEVSVDSLQPGDLVRIRPGEKFPVDGKVTEGRSDVDESSLTGEPVPALKESGHAVLAGTLNGTGTLVVRTTRAGRETTLGQVIEMVSAAQRSRMPVQNLADRIAEWFVPAVLAVAVATFVVWFFLEPSHALPNAVAVLIIACPCAIGLAVPMSVTVGVGLAARRGILVRDAAALQVLSRVTVVAIDKTGTLTEGRPRLVKIEVQPGFSEDEALRLAGSVERASEHPLAGAVLRAAEERKLSLEKVGEFFSEAGGGVGGLVGRRQILAGSSRFLKSRGVEVPDHEGVLVAADGRWMGSLLVEDTLRAESLPAIADMKRLGLDLLMLTGDSPAAAGRIASQAGIAHWRAGLTPVEKAKEIRQAQSGGATVLMAGDGVNDAPAFSVADVAAAMGGGADIAKESAGILLLNNHPAALVAAVRLGRATMGNIRQNLFFAFIYNILGIPLAAGVFYPFTGWLLNPVIAGAAMSLSSVTVIASALTLAKGLPSGAGDHPGSPGRNA